MARRGGKGKTMLGWDVPRTDREFQTSYRNILVRKHLSMRHHGLFKELMKEIAVWDFYLVNFTFFKCRNRWWKSPFLLSNLSNRPSQRGVFPIACFPFLLCYFITLITLACIFSPHSYRKWLQLQLSCSQTDVLRGGGILWVTLRWLLRVPHSNL